MINRMCSRRALLKGGSASLVIPLLCRGSAAAQEAAQPSDAVLADLIEAAAEPLPEIADPDFARFVDRYSEAKVVLLGEASHGTDEFYRARTAITERLVREHGFTVVAVEADWPDAARIDAHIRGAEALPSPNAPFPRFPAWMWRNRAVEDLMARLRAYNEEVRDPARQVGFYGLDLYSLPSSMDAVEEFARRHDPAALDDIRARYGCLAPYAEDPQAYGAVTRGPAADSCSADVTSVIDEVLGARLGEIGVSNRAFLDAVMNAHVVAASEAYYRAMYEGSVASWNLRDTHMFETLKRVLEAHGDSAKAVIWAHNSHIGDARATGMGAMGEINLGQLAREEWGEGAVLIGFGTDRGTVTAATAWNSAPETLEVNTSLPGSWGALMRDARPDPFLLDLRQIEGPLADAFAAERIERYIGVLYMRQTELPSHYITSAIGQEYDAYIWLEETRAVEPVPLEEIEVLPEEHPFAL
jgi:erythromycin esterase-like protein